MWSQETSQGFESDKIAALVIPYTRGRGLDIGCGMRKVWPHAIGVDNGHHFGGKTCAEVAGDGSDLSMFSNNALDFVFSSHTLEHFHEEKVPAILAEWARVIKPGGYMVLYVPSANLYPKCEPTLQPGANPDHKWDIYPGDIAEKLAKLTTCGWTQVEDEERGREKDNNEYSLFEVYQKREDGAFVHQPWERNPQGLKRCLVIRYGAIGDQIIAASILPVLKKQGYYITYNVATESQDILRHDPNIDEFLLQDKDQVPNMQLGAYWETLKWSKRYDKIINLCESIEGALLTLPGRLTNDYSHGARHKLLNHNYLERTHDIADVPHDFAPRFYPTIDEHDDAIAERSKHSGPVIQWALNGSSPHKVYPWVQIVAAWLMQKTPAHLYFTGDPKDGKLLQDAIIRELEGNGVDTSRIHAMAGIWKIRQTLTFAQVADCVVGPETGVLNAVSFEPMPKVIYLSHSSVENLTKHWVNTHSLTPEEARCPCYPCHRLLSGWDHCNQNKETAAAQCASSITPERVFETIIRALKTETSRKRKAA